MIYLDVTGRCGNQMFQYAFARKISLLNDDKEMTVDFSWVYEYAKRRGEESFIDELCNFRASNNYTRIVDRTNRIYRYGSKKQVFVFKVYTIIKRFLQRFIKDKRIANKLMYPIMSHYGIYWYIAPKKLKRCKQKNKFIFGYFEDPRYFSDIQKVLCDDFTPKYPLDEKNEELVRKINEKQSVCVSFRKWIETNEVMQDREICGKEYYSKAFEIMQEKYPDCTFVLFSNEIEWVKEHFDLPDNCLFESGNDPIYEKIRLMSACDHFILSNSSFAWWVQFLGKSKDKSVVSPNRWYNSEKIRDPLIMEDFIIVE